MVLGNLRRFLSSEPIRLCGLEEREVRDILLDVSSGLDHLHAHQITHRDIKPDNIVLQHCAERPGRTLYKIIGKGAEPATPLSGVAPMGLQIWATQKS